MKMLTGLDVKGTQAVRRMRLQKLSSGHPFMINAKELASNQCYLEYPDGRIRQVAVERASRDFQIIRELSRVEADNLRNRHQL